MSCDLMLSMAQDHPRQVSQGPIVTGTSVLGIKFKDGIVIAADLLASYGSLARFRNCSRIMRVNESTIVGCSGDYADFHYLSSIIEQKIISEECLNDGFNLKPKSLYCWLTRFLYNRRSKFDPLWNTFVVGGLQDGVPFLGQIDKLGASYEDDTIATGYGSYIARPLMIEELTANPQMTEEEAIDVMKRSLTILYYRDGRSFPKYEVAVVSSSGSKIVGPFELQSNWAIAESANIGH